MTNPFNKRIPHREALYWLTFAMTLAILALWCGTTTLNEQMNKSLSNQLSQNEYLIKTHSTQYEQTTLTSTHQANSQGYVTKNMGRSIVAEVTKYSRETCTTPIGCTTAMGTTPEAGKTIACPRIYKLGTKVSIDGHTYVCEDRTHLSLDGRFDIWQGYSVEDWEAAKAWGNQLKTVTIL